MDIKHINRVKWICIIAFSFLLSFILFVLGLSAWTIKYWLINLTVSYIFNKECICFFRKMYETEKKKGLKFKDYIKDKKANN